MSTVSLPEALGLLAQPRQRGGRGAATSTPLRELGPDTTTGKPMLIREGRFGPYVTDGEVNASLRKGDDVATLTDGRAMELLADKRAKGPSTPRKLFSQEGGSGEEEEGSSEALLIAAPAELDQPLRLRRI